VKFVNVVNLFINVIIIQILVAIIFLLKLIDFNILETLDIQKNLKIKGDEVNDIPPYTRFKKGILKCEYDSLKNKHFSLETYKNI